MSTNLDRYLELARKILSGETAEDTANTGPIVAALIIVDAIGELKDSIGGDIKTLEKQLDYIRGELAALKGI